MDNETFSEIVAEYEKQRSKNRNERSDRVAAVYEQVPDIAKIDREISRIGSETLKAILTNPENKNAKEEMSNKFKILNQKKKELLHKNNIPEDFDKLRYKCASCKDTGYVEGQGRCSCFKQKMIDFLYRQSNMGELLNKQNFSNFDFAYYDKNINQGTGISPYVQMKKIRSACESFIENFDEAGKSLLFTGDTGLGKTFMSSCVAKELLDKGKNVIYIRSARLFKMFEDDRFGRLPDGMEYVYNCDLLIIDDLGTEASGKNNNSYLLELLNERIDNEKKMIINSNYKFDELQTIYGQRFASRILENFLVMYFFGTDIRKQKFFY